MQQKIKPKQRILQVAADLFYRQGYTQTGINQIIAEADIAIGSLYKHFPSKNDLLVAYLQMKEEEWLADFEKYCKDTDNPKAKIIKYVDFRIEQQLKTGFCGCPFIKIISQLEAAEIKVLQIVEGHKNKQKALLYNFFKQLPDAGLWDKKQLSENIFVLVEGAVVTSTIYRNTQALESAKKFIKKILA
jgi:AcrR family transcriptional regulator